jgi:5-(carboxyamino)imidazole ribonucleotide synthase
MKVGVMGGGQLGQMLAIAAPRVGCTMRFISPDPSAPAGLIAELIVADYENDAALAHFAEGLDVVTYEFESIPSKPVRSIEEQIPVRPSTKILEIAQDRAFEKRCFERLGIPTSPFEVVETMRDAREALERIGLPAVLKTRRMGYDGKGQGVIQRRDDLAIAWIKTNGAPAIVEKFVKFRRELSIIAVRSTTGETAFYPLVENHHDDGLLRFSLAPAPAISEETQREAEDYATRIMVDLDYAGVIALELFETDNGLVANEMAPRVHNTGHWTIEAADTSQFENHLRAICGMPLGSTEMSGAAGMVNVIGREPDIERLRGVRDVHVHMYGKSPAPRRKLGHITVTADDLAGVRTKVGELRPLLVK